MTKFRASSKSDVFDAENKSTCSTASLILIMVIHTVQFYYKFQGCKQLSKGETVTSDAFLFMESSWTLVYSPWGKDAEVGNDEDEEEEEEEENVNWEDFDDTDYSESDHTEYNAASNSIELCHQGRPCKVQIEIVVHGNHALKGEHSFKNDSKKFYFNGTWSNSVNVSCTLTSHQSYSVKHEVLRAIRTKYLQDQRTDFKVMVGSSTIPVHKQILEYQSPVFEAMFHSSMQEAERNELIITEFTEPAARCFLNLLYDISGTYNCLSFQEKLEVLNLAHKYKVPSLVRVVEKDLCSSMTVENSLTVLVMADRLSCALLKAEALKFIKSNIKKVIRMHKLTMAETLGALAAEVLIYVKH